MKIGPIHRDIRYGLSIDSSSDNEREKMYPLSVKIFDKSGVSSELLNMCVSKSSTAEGIFEVMDKELKCIDIKWSNCSGLDWTIQMQTLGNTVESKLLFSYTSL